MKNLLLLLMAISLSFAITSCGEREGCTDPSSANYDPEAEIDDGSCTSYNRDRFYGTYLGTFLCNNTLLKPALDNDSLIFEIKEPVSPDDYKHVIMVIFIDGLPVELDGSISGNALTIDDTQPGLKVPDFPAEGVDTEVNVIGLGNATFSSDERTLDGELKLTLEFADGSGSAEDTCALTGVKQ